MKINRVDHRIFITIRTFSISLTGSFPTPSPSMSSSQASPIPSKSTSSWPLFGTSRQLSCIREKFAIIIQQYYQYTVPSQFELTYPCTPEFFTTKFNVRNSIQVTVFCAKFPVACVTNSTL